MAQARLWVTRHKGLALLSTALGATVLVLAFLGVAAATDQPAFCTSCHEMGAYYDAWQAGPHAGVSCIECHVAPGTYARAAHKLVALREIWVHVAGDPSFPLAQPPDVPDSRCIACHDDVDDGADPGFSHDQHAAEGTCVSCHDNAGHTVTPDALIAHDVYNPKTGQAALARRVAAAGEGKADLIGHVKTACESCHDMKATACESCHAPKHEERPASCTTCHSPGLEWTFTHPTGGECESCHAKAESHPAVAANVACAACHAKRGVDWTFAHRPEPDCESCHARPAGHRRGACTTCHSVGSTWTFTHTTAQSCAQCHARPARHSGASCASCHKNAGTNWKFSHPGSGSTCTTCHARPARHSGASCVTCHTVGRSWAFSHPGSGSTCTTCHARPAGHSQSTCTSCHAVGATWAFRHPASTSCTSCHRAPANHYGSACASCHSPSASWRSAVFSHPRLKEHTYKSFSCVSCHPAGYSSASCTRCHGADGPDDDDDDDD